MTRICAISLSLALLPLLVALETRAATEPPWLEVTSAHFTVITDAGDKKGREVALRFEQMRAVFAGLLTKERLHQSIPLTILALNNDKSYYQVAPLRQGQPIGVPGFFLPGEDQDFIVLNLSEEESWRAVTHDFGLMLLNYNYPPAQGWFDEGLAEYFSSIRVDNRQVEIGGDPELVPSVTQDLLGNQRDTHAAKSLTELLGAQVWMSLPDLFAMKHDPSARNEGTRHTLYYAESWMVMHYLLHEKKLPETGTYFDLVLNQHVPVEDAIQKAYGMSSVQLEQAVKDYFRSQAGLAAAVDAARKSNPDPTNPGRSGAVEHFPAPVGPDSSAILSKPIPEPDARALYAGIQTRIPERRELGLKALQDLATTPTAADQKAQAKHETKRVGEDPEQLPSNSIGNPTAHRNLAWDYIQHGQFDEAFSEMGDAAALNPRDMWIRYYLSVAKYRMAQAKHSDMLGLANMMLDLKGVLEWYPEMADAYDLLAVARKYGGGPAAAMQAERAAISLSPRDERYIFHLAEIYVAGKKWEAANALLDRLKVSNNPQIASRARDLLSQAGVERKYGIPVDAKGTPQPKYEAQKSPFDVLEQDAAKRDAAEHQSESATPPDQRSTKFVKGRLVGVDCSKPPAAVLTIHSDAGLLTLHADDYKSILLIGADDFSCEWRDLQVTVNYKPRTGGIGDLVSLEMR
jgi:tetratricopeptide (TPR) repeat protein